MNTTRIDYVTINGNGAYAALEHLHGDGTTSRAVPVLLTGKAKQAADDCVAALAKLFSADPPLAAGAADTVLDALVQAAQQPAAPPPKLWARIKAVFQPAGA